MVKLEKFEQYKWDFKVGMENSTIAECNTRVSSSHVILIHVVVVRTQLQFVVSAIANHYLE